jgi:hypothetical protein
MRFLPVAQREAATAYARDAISSAQLLRDHVLTKRGAAVSAVWCK